MWKLTLGYSSPGQNWWQTLSGRKISCSQWEGPRCLAFFLLKFGGVGGGGFHFSLIPNVFPLSSQYVPQVFSIASHFYLICFGKCFPPCAYIGGAKGKELYTSKWGTFYFAEPPYFHVSWVMNQSNWLVAKKKLNLESPHRINRRGEIC
jgi:hypothetical protein